MFSFQFRLASTRLPFRPNIRYSLTRAKNAGHLTVVSTRGMSCQGDNPSTTSNHNSVFLRQVEETVNRVLEAFPKEIDVSSVKQEDRETLMVARRLQSILSDQGGKCPRCWLREEVCICQQCPPLEAETQSVHPTINRIFVLMHHQEICLAVDTAKLILSSFPQTARLVVSGIGPEFQDSMKEMQQAIMGVDNGSKDNNHRKCLVLFPTPDAKTFEEMSVEDADESDAANPPSGAQISREGGWDLVVIDGTWSQARKLHERYIADKIDGGPRRVKLGSNDVDQIGSTGSDNGADGGRQLRKHPIQWREISTLEALRLLLRDFITHGNSTTNNNLKDVMGTTQVPVWESLAIYHDLANDAARQQRGR